MFIVVIGGSGSGKSELSESLAVKLNQDKLIYLATMKPFGEEGRKRIERHQKLRQDKNFRTIECYTNLSTVSIAQGSTVLLECMSNLVANEMFSDDNVIVNTVEKQGNEIEKQRNTFKKQENILKKVAMNIRQIIHQADHLIIVTNNVFEDGFQYDDTTMEYMKVLGQINQQICTIADQVIEVVHGIPIYIINK
jgi:adenosylcobinamide kinase/adenosylcobinamide-phosphate guanylyltransferase